MFLIGGHWCVSLCFLGWDYLLCLVDIVTLRDCCWSKCIVNNLLYMCMYWYRLILSCNLKASRPAG